MKIYVKALLSRLSVLRKLAIRFYCIFVDNIFKNFINYLRICLFIPSRYNSIKKYKNKHIGERCFIVATGPSLTISDLTLLSGEICFSMNSIIKAFDKTNWRPTYYGIQDPGVYHTLLNEGVMVKERFNNIQIFYNSRIKNFCIEGAQPFFLDYLFHGTLHFKKYLFSHDFFRTVYDGHSISYSLLQLAVYMGFKEIYLLGLDAEYPMAGKLHFIDYGNFGAARGSKQGQISAFEYAKKYLDSKGIHVYNATRGGALEVFPRVILENVLENRKQST